MAKRLSNKNQALLALGAAAAIGVFLYTRKKNKVAGIGAVGLKVKIYPQGNDIYSVRYKLRGQNREMLIRGKQNAERYAEGVKEAASGVLSKDTIQQHTRFGFNRQMQADPAYYKGVKDAMEWYDAFRMHAY